jgi:ATP-dependent protease ClpP protease subunit
VKTLRIDIYDFIGAGFFTEGITAKSISRKLNDAQLTAGDEIEVHINSPGGDAFEGIAIHNLLKDHPANVTVIIDGVAASAASAIAVAGDKVIIPTNGLVMIHDPVTFAVGGVEDMNKAIAALDAVKKSLVNTYVAKSKQSAEKIASWMKDETWFTGQEAVDAGLADTTQKAKAVAAPADKTSAKAQAHWFKKMPAEFAALVALSVHDSTSNLYSEESDMFTQADIDNAVAKVNAAHETKLAELTAAHTKAIEAKAGELAAAHTKDVDAKVADAKAAAAKEVRDACADVVAICVKAKRPELAVEAITKNKPLADVRSELLDALIKDNEPVGDDPKQQGGGKPKNDDPEAKFKAEYSANAAAYQAAGMSEADYVQQRKIDAGLVPLAAKKLALPRGLRFPG